VACVLFANFNKYSTPYFSGILDGIDSELFKKEYQLSIYTTAQLNSSPALFSKVIDPEKIDGLILISAGEIAPKARERVKPIVCVNFIDDGYDSLDVDRERGVYDAVTYLAGLGHRKIAFVGRDRNQNLVDKKFSGYCRALAEAGIDYKESLVTGTGYGIETGYAALKEIRAQNAAPTAVFAASDMTAFGVMKAAGELGLKVPDDLSLIGYDDIESAQIAFPPLTTVRVDKQYLGTLCARRILERIDDPVMKPVRTIIPTELIIRSSCRGLAG